MFSQRIKYLTSRVKIRSIQCSQRSLQSRSKSTGNQDYEYLQKSSIPTFKFQQSLPQLPIPKLDETCERYLSAMRPFIADDHQYNNTVNIVRNFQSNIGPELHKKLLQQNEANKHTSYLAESWADMYFECRLPLPLNLNPYIACVSDPESEYNEQSVRASNFIISAMRFKKSLDNQVLIPEVNHMDPSKSDTELYRTKMQSVSENRAYEESVKFKAFPMDMCQYGNLFNSTRIPKISRDCLKTSPGSTHVVILKGGQFYIFDTHNKAGHLRSPAEIHSCVKYISQLKQEPDWASITTFSTEERDQWAKVREHLTRNSLNRESIDLLDSAAFVVCLDDQEFGEGDVSKLSNNFLHGSQTSRPLNRWFDKSFSFIFTKDGEASVNFEHSWGDGVTIIRFFRDIFDDIVKNRFAKLTDLQKNLDCSQEVRRLNFVFDETIADAAKSSNRRYREITAKLHLEHVNYQNMDRAYFKKKKLSPDSVYQLAFQMAFFQIYNFTPPTYESCSTAMFKHGRTENIRAATIETQETSKAFLENKLSLNELRGLLNQCAKKHSRLAREATGGHGCDRHLFGMKNIALKNGEPLPDLYTDLTHQRSSHFILSTSCLFGDVFSTFGFGPVVEDGFGIGYGYSKNGLGFVCSSWEGQRDCKQFGDSFKLCMDKIHSVLEQT